MDNQRFDNLARLLGRGTSRRTALKGLAGGALVTLGLARGASEAAAQMCGGEGVYCTADTDCCSGTCANFYCTAPSAPMTNACMNDGGACAADGDCCSGSCDGSSGACFTPAAAVDTSTDAPADTTAAPAAEAVTLPVTGAGPAAEAENDWVMPVAAVGVAAAILGAHRLRREASEN